MKHIQKPLFAAIALLVLALCISPVAAEKIDVDSEGILEKWDMFGLFSFLDDGASVTAQKAPEPQKTTIVGEWKGEKSVPFLAEGKGTISIFENGTAKAEVSATILGKTYSKSVTGIKWEQVENRYLGKYDKFKAEFVLSDNKLKATVNPYEMGMVNNFLFNINIPIELTDI